MTGPVLRLAAVALLAAGAAVAAAAVHDIELLKYETVLKKGQVGLKLLESLGPFFIPDGQCSGVLDSVLTCSFGVPVAVHVRVEDSAGYPRVTLEDSLSAASVLRAPPCRGEAAVTLQRFCGPILGAPALL